MAESAPLSLSPDKEHMLITTWGTEPRDEIQRIRDEFPQIEVSFVSIDATDNFVEVLSLSDLVPKELWDKATILVTLFALPRSLELVPNLKYIHLFSAGIDHFSEHPLLQPSATSTSSIRWTTSTGIAAPPIAEHILMTLLSLTKQLPLQLSWQRSRTWGRKPTFLTSPGDWVSKKVGILGYGSIGRHTARLLSALGAEVHAYTATPRDTAASKRDRNYCIPGTGDPDGSIPTKWYSGTSKADIHAFLSVGLHALIISAPLTPHTRHLIGAAELSLLHRTSPYTASRVYDAPASSPAGAFIVNISRGQIIDQTALVDALKRRVIRGAALDVTDPEPLPEHSELWLLDNCIVTPHTSALGSEYRGRAFDVLREKLRRMERGEEMVNLVSSTKGY